MTPLFPSSSSEALFSFGSPPERLQGLSPSAARFCLSVARFAEKELRVTLAGRKILVGFSGGADSTALLLALHYLAPKLHLTLAAAHLDHALRPSSAREAASCFLFCKQLGIDCITERVDVATRRAEHKEGLEEAARNTRYDLYARALREQKCDMLALGHQADDLAEDVLMRLLRGTGWPGLGGMAGYDPARALLRPLLLTPRAAIEDFLRELGLNWIRDLSNTDPAFLRNRIRNNLLPLFIAENPAFLAHIGNLWRLARLDGELFHELLANGLSSPGREEATTTEELAPLGKALRLRLYKAKLDALGPGQARLDGLFALDAAWRSNPEKTEHLFPGGKQAHVHGGQITWRKKKKE